ncbi:F-box/LRR-repeat protein 2 [Diachasma alloeum]|uniref:F-box/LRR-repeat protein 2 n=1 Tax=Diachasma alloeum TaxID=454923 RepID=UPI0007382720|nr:F-box/LRR-repeat protein 2 [Diachasma alloeum]
MEHIARTNLPWDSYMGRYHGMCDPILEQILKRGGENSQKHNERLIEMWSTRTRNHTSQARYKRLLRSLNTEAVSDSNSINNKLNDDCLETIFEYLPAKDKLAFEYVCKRWKEVAVSGWLRVRSLNLYESPGEDDTSPSDKARTNRIFGGILKKCGDHLQRLKIGNPCDYNILSAVNQYCQNLTILKVSFTKFTTQDARMFPRMQNLKHLEIRGLKHYPKHLFEVLPVDSLTEIHLWATGYGSLPLIAPTVLERCTKLTALSLNGFAPDPNVLNVISQKSELKSLSLSNCLLNVGLPSLKLLTNLERLDLSWVSGVVECYVEQLSKFCEKLKHLDLTHCSSLDDQGIAHLAKLPQLEGLIVKRIPEITDAPFRNLRHLTELQCGYNSRIRDPGMIALLENAPHLQYLNVRRTSVTEVLVTEAEKITERRTNNLPLCVLVSRSVGVMSEVFSCLIAGVNNSVFESQYPEKGERKHSYHEERQYLSEY